MRFPVIQRVPPQLAGGREIIGRDACNLRRVALGIQLEQLLPAPDIAAVDRHKDRDITDDQNFLPGRVFPEAVPLLLEQELGELEESDLAGKLFGVRRFGLCFAVPDIIIPVQPAAALEIVLDCAEQGIVIQPVSLLFAELFKLNIERKLRVLPHSVSGIRIGAGCLSTGCIGISCSCLSLGCLGCLSLIDSGSLLLKKMLISLLQDADLILDRGAVIDLLGIPLPFALQVMILQETVLFQKLRAYDIDLACER